MDGKITLITGAGSGIGAAIAHTFSQAGAFVYVTDLHLHSAEATTLRLNAGKKKAEALAMDVTRETDAQRIAEHVHKQHGHLDVLINNAGIGMVGTLLETTGEDFDRILGVNVRGIFNLCRAFLPGMVERRSGNIINLASIAGIVAIRDRLAYSTSKFAVVGLTKNLALDHARDGVRCNCICPGRVETPFVTARLAEYPDPEKARTEMASTQALGRMAQPEEIAAAALYLASDESAFMTGSEFIIDGGWSAGK